MFYFFRTCGTNFTSTEFSSTLIFFFLILCSNKKQKKERERHQKVKLQLWSLELFHTVVRRVTLLATRNKSETLHRTSAANKRSFVFSDQQIAASRLTYTFPFRSIYLKPDCLKLLCKSGHAHITSFSHRVETRACATACIFLNHVSAFLFNYFYYFI